MASKPADAPGAKDAAAAAERTNVAGTAAERTNVAGIATTEAAAAPDISNTTPRKAHALPLILVALHVLLGVYALSDVASKYAGQNEFLSPIWIACYAAVLVLLGVYAIGWQQIIKHMPLSSAYAHRAVTIVWGMFWGLVLFGEAITVGKVVGAAIIIAGIVLYVRADAETQADASEPAAVEPPSPSGETRGAR